MNDVKASLKTVYSLKKFLLLMFFIVSMSFICRTSDSSYITNEQLQKNKQQVESYKELVKVWEYQEHYNAIVDTLKWHEGYRAYPYYCLAGVLTVGYGHAIKRGDLFTYPMSEETADSLLRADLDAAINFVGRTTDLEHLQLLAIGHFVFALGSGSFHKSTLRQHVLNGKPIDNEIVKWIHIRTSNGIIKSEHLKRSRIMELNLYNGRT